MTITCDDLLMSMKCLNAIYKKIVYEDKERYEPEMYDLFKRTERILENKALVHEICAAHCNPTIVTPPPPPLPLPQYVNMAYFRNWEQDNLLSGAKSTDIEITDITDGVITVNFIPEDVRTQTSSTGQFYLMNRSKTPDIGMPADLLQIYVYTMDELTPTPNEGGGTITIAFGDIPPYTGTGLVFEDLFEVGDLIAFINPYTVLKPIYPYGPLIDLNSAQ